MKKNNIKEIIFTCVGIIVFFIVMISIGIGLFLPSIIAYENGIRSIWVPLANNVLVFVAVIVMFIILTKKR